MVVTQIGKEAILQSKNSSSHEYIQSKMRVERKEQVRKRDNI